MGKILIIQGADFSQYKVDSIVIRKPGEIYLEDYIDSTYSVDSTEYVKVLIDFEYKILYGVTTDGSVVDYSSELNTATTEDNTKIIDIIKEYKKTI